MKSKRILSLFALFLTTTVVFAQKQIEYRSERGQVRPESPNDITLIDNVVFVHNGMTMYCDSAIYNKKDNYFFAYKNIVMVDKQTTLSGDELQYYGNEKIGYLSGKEVVLEDDDVTMLTDYLLLDRNDNTVRYLTGATIWNSEDTLKSNEGVYYIDDKLFYFLYSVELFSEKAYMNTDTLIYNTKSKQADFFGKTNINTSDSINVIATQGSYNSKTEEIYSEQRPDVYTKEQYLTADTIYYNKKEKTGYAYGKIFIQDTTQDVIIECNKVLLSKIDTLSVATLSDSILCRQIDKEDTLYFHSDTMFVTMDTNFNAKKLDAYYHCKFFRSDMQGAAEFCTYLVDDSILTMLVRPILWNEESQLTADTIQLKVSDKHAEKIFMYPNPLIVQNSDTTTQEHFNQVKGKNLEGWFENNNIKYAEVTGNVEIVYYLWDENKKKKTKELIGVNIGQSKQLNLYFKSGTIKKLSAVSNPNYYIDADENISEEIKRLKGFVWSITDKPTKANDIFIHRK
ncbi:MAG: hypothetical protein IJ213_04575 [Bacteroidales bacterium]|nr:hypothetical protein [Bacteroidales bacterium]